MNRGEIYYADLSPVIGSEQGGYRPVLILQNNKGNNVPIIIFSGNPIMILPSNSHLCKIS